MTRPNAALSLPPERELPLSQELDAPPEPEPVKRPGIKLELDRISALFDEARMALADANLANEQNNLASLEAECAKISALAMHALKTTTALRVRERQKEKP